MSRKFRRLAIFVAGLVLSIASLACQALFPKSITPGSIEEKIAMGSIRFEGRGNLSYGKCQDPTAVVTVTIDPPVKEYNGQTFYDSINPVSVSAITDGAIPMSGSCEKFNIDEKHNWPAKGIYYPKEEKILFFSCSLTDGSAGGEANLAGTGSDVYFEGEYGCYGSNGELVYEIAFTAAPADE